MYTSIVRFEWDPKKAATNLIKHGVSFEEAIEVFDDPAALEKYDSGHSEVEDRLGRIGSTAAGVMAVVYTKKTKNIVRIISARRASRRERSIYHG